MTVGASTRLRWRERWRRLHLWLGLSLGGVFVLLGLTGSVLVLYETGRYPTAAKLIAAARRRKPKTGRRTAASAS